MLKLKNLNYKITIIENPNQLYLNCSHHIISLEKPGGSQSKKKEKKFVECKKKLLVLMPEALLDTTSCHWLNGLNRTLTHQIRVPLLYNHKIIWKVTTRCNLRVFPFLLKELTPVALKWGLRAAY